jgi:hypothetical protein
MRASKDILLQNMDLSAQPQVPFDFAQGRLSTAIGAQNAPISAQDDS